MLRYEFAKTDISVNTPIYGIAIFPTTYAPDKKGVRSVIARVCVVLKKFARFVITPRIVSSI